MSRYALTASDRRRISDAIKAAEAGHRGEIVVHVEPRVFGDPLKRAAKLFTEKGVDKTKDGTGVLLYLATANRAAAVWAGRGIEGGAEVATWKPVFDALATAGSDHAARICAAVIALGQILTVRCAGADIHGNELGDGVSS
jgi:uncharacterized membrane protein